MAREGARPGKVVERRATGCHGQDSPGTGSGGQGGCCLRRTAQERGSCACGGGRNHSRDGEVVVGIASVDESAITGESAPVIRRAAATAAPSPAGRGSCRIGIIVRITTNPGETFLDKMIANGGGRQASEDAERNRLDILLAVLTLIFVLPRSPWFPFRFTASGRRGRDLPSA